MTTRGATAVSFLDLVSAGRSLPAPARVRVALDALEPIAAGSAPVRLKPRLAGSRFDLANVRIAVRGRAKVVGTGNRSGLAVLLWEILAGRSAPPGSIPPLSAVVDDVEPEVAQVIDAAVAGDAFPDAPALLKALVVATAGSVGRHQETAKLLSATPEPAVPVRTPRTPAEPAAEPAPLEPTDAEPAPADPLSAALDAVVGEELSRIAPDGWDDWDLTADGPAPEPPAVVEAPPRGPGPRRAPPPPEPRDPGLDRPDVVLIEPDHLTAAHVGGILRRAGYLIEICHDEDSGISRMCMTQPRCVVCDEELLERGGPAVALRARTNSPRACLAPFIFLTPRPSDPSATRTRAGARDVWLVKPFSNDALLDHVRSFAPAPNPRERATSMLPPSGETAMSGDLAHISLATILSMLELERRSGRLDVTSGLRRAALAFQEGRVVKARVDDRAMRPAEAREILATWQEGRFSFKAVVAGETWSARDVVRTGG